MNADALQRALYLKLTGDIDVAAAVVGVYADVQQPAKPEDDAGFPYITIGRDNITPWDTKTDFGAEALCQIDVWSRSNNLIEVKEIGELIWFALHHRGLTIENSDHVMTVQQSANYLSDPDGHTKRAVLSFRITYTFS